MSCGGARRVGHTAFAAKVPNAQQIGAPRKQADRLLNTARVPHAAAPRPSLALVRQAFPADSDPTPLCGRTTKRN